jgi:hypothetical protein
MKDFGAAALRRAIVVGFVLLAAPAGAYANVLYDLTLTDPSDPMFDGTGTISLTSAPSASGLSSLGSAAVTFLIDGQQFSGTATAVQFQDGAFRNATFAEQIGSSPFRFALDTTSGYVFFYNNELSEAFGTITATLATQTGSAPPSPTPLPAGLPLFATALAGLGLLGWYRKRSAVTA